MSNFKPGEFRITDYAMEIWKLPAGAEVLDIGCGQGHTVEYIENKYGYKASGIDISKAMIKEGRMRNPELNIKFGDGEFLDGFSSYTFDGVMMECALSLINMPDESLHEAYCVLKKGGKLFISDLYIKNPEPEFLVALAIEAERQKNLPHNDGDCGTEHTEGECSDCNDCSDCDSCGGENGTEFAHDNKNRAVSFRSSGRFLITPLIEHLKGIGYINIEWNDCSVELDNYVAEKIMKDGTLEGCICEEGMNPKDHHKTGYFMLTAEKPL